MLTIASRSGSTMVPHGRGGSRVPETHRVPRGGIRHWPRAVADHGEIAAVGAVGKPLHAGELLARRGELTPGLDVEDTHPEVEGPADREALAIGAPGHVIRNPTGPIEVDLAKDASR